MGSASSDARRPSYEELEALVAELMAQNQGLRERVEELERQLGRNSLRCIWTFDRTKRLDFSHQLVGRGGLGGLVG